MQDPALKPYSADSPFRSNRERRLIFRHAKHPQHVCHAIQSK